MASSTNQVFLLVDESGAKGYSDTREQTPFEIGVMAGLLVRPSQKSKLDSFCETLISNFFSEKPDLKRRTSRTSLRRKKKI
jgi:hypothetical protein